MTEAQPNYRGNRNLHCLQGLDYVYCLRGLQRVQFFDYDQWLTWRKKKVSIRDSGFVESIRSAVQQEKQLEHYVRSRLRNLSPLIPGYDPPEEVWKCLEAIGVAVLEPEPGRVADAEGSESGDELDNSSLDLNPGSSEEPMVLDSSSDSDSDESMSDDTEVPAQVKAEASSNIDDKRLADAADGRTSEIIDLTDDAADVRMSGINDLTGDGDYGSMRRSTSGSGGGRHRERNSNEESSLFVGDAMGGIQYDDAIDRAGSPPAFGRERLIESIESEESGLFVSNEPDTIIDLTSDGNELG
ncbi:uncharacterized protein HRG_07684 [Hirsutella rhossiliensis]|uniref:Uncharacterized protein n=1 Tax=Hirsutella rhossiliensis TaxID=111463 RepID=A0A9P8SGB5_9HYPO|nr:uncharacterized protein HRG_07684 [Hirsutella rhossiliensis]KAH0961606.1 hypothetical protein HRG_07684 [Hirsutella rhossiliensis]